MQIVLPWPDKALSPNGRAHWRTVAEKKGKARDDAFWLTKKANTGAGKLTGHESGYAVRCTFHPKTRHPVDQDNCLASMKAAFDGIAAAIGVDDRHFAMHTPVIAEPVKGGQVIVNIEVTE